MQKIFPTAFVLLLALVIQSCGLHYGFMQDSASLNEGNFTYVAKDISGTSRTTQILGIGGLSKLALTREAKESMLLTHELQPNQAIANLSVDWKRSFFIVGTITKCTVTADIVQFEEEDD